MKKRLGQLLFILSFAIYGIVLLVPSSPLSAGSKILSSSILVILAEASFWVSVLILGRKLISDYKSLIWRRGQRDAMSMIDRQEDGQGTDLCDSRIQPGKQDERSKR